MLATDEDAVVCDFAETYHVLDIWALDLRLAATLAAGLAPDSRIMRRLRGERDVSESIILAAAADNIALIRWYLSKDGQDGKNPPKSILAAMAGQGDAKTEAGGLTFKSPEAFEAYRAKLIGE